jgi:hypothetical protein
MLLCRFRASGTDAASGTVRIGQPLFHPISRVADGLAEHVLGDGPVVGAVSRRAPGPARWPVIVALDEVADAATAARVAIRRGAPAPSPDAVHQLTNALYPSPDAAGVPPTR